MTLTSISLTGMSLDTTNIEALVDTDKSLNTENCAMCPSSMNKQLPIEQKWSNYFGEKV